MFANVVQEATFGSQQVINRRGEPDDRFYYIIKGEIQEFFERKVKGTTLNIQLRKLQKGSEFGLGGLLIPNYV